MDALRARLQGVRNALRSPRRRLNHWARQNPRTASTIVWLFLGWMLTFAAFEIVVYIRHLVTGRFNKLPQFIPQDVQPQQLLILLWSTSPLHQDSVRMPARSVMNPDIKTTLGLASCTSSNEAVTCNVTKDRDLAQNSNVVVFDADSVHSADLPSSRHADQLWVLWTHGPPRKEPLQDLREMTFLFNWTMGFRQDADVVVPYRKWSTRREALSSPDTPSALHNKTVTAAWIIGECEQEELQHSDAFSPLASNNWKGSEGFMNDILGSVEVKIIHKCGAQLCSSRDSCLSILEEEYFFIFVLESSPCFESPVQMIYDSLQYYIVPVFFGARDLTTSLPPNSFVDTSKLRDSSAVVNALGKLQNSPRLYDDFIHKRRQFEVTKPTNALCSVCDALSGSPKKPLHSDVVMWWQSRTTCANRPVAQIAAPDSSDTLSDLPGV